MSRRIRSLEEVSREGGRLQDFAFDYAGDYLPPRPPHKGSWSYADKHWVEFNSNAMATDLVPRDASSQMALELSERFAVNVLWVLVLLRNCPHCPDSARLHPDLIREAIESGVRDAL